MMGCRKAAWEHCGFKALWVRICFSRWARAAASLLSACCRPDPLHQVKHFPAWFGFCSVCPWRCLRHLSSTPFKKPILMGEGATSPVLALIRSGMLIAGVKSKSRSNCKKKAVKTIPRQGHVRSICSSLSSTSTLNYPCSPVTHTVDSWLLSNIGII